MKDTKIALGTWAWGSGAFGGDAVYGLNTNEENLKPVFEAAAKAGLGLWDTATVYAMGDSERILGQFVASVPRESVQNHFSLLYRSSERGGVLDYCHRNNIRFWSYMVL